MTDELRIAINVDALPGIAGGVVQAMQGLIFALGRLEGPEKYVICAATQAHREWIEPCCGPNQQIVVRKEYRPGPSMTPGDVSNKYEPLLRRLRARLRPTIHFTRRMAGRLVPQAPAVSLSDGFLESLGCDVVHFPTQGFTVCAIPTVYNPHDLQHLHYPQFWTPWELAYREVTYRAGCNFSRTVVVGSEWIKQDVIRQYGLHESKVQIIPWAPPTAHYGAVDSQAVELARGRLGLADAFALYPAVTWPHKNHLRLFDALALLRDQRGLRVNLVCTGARYESHWPNIERRLTELTLHDQVRFLGYLSERDLLAVYQMATFLVMPTLFEADSCPIFEAWAEGLPVTSSNHTALPDQVGDAALQFDALDVAAIADAIHRMTTDARLREELIRRGRQRVGDFDWTRTAKSYRAVYRRAAGRRLSDEDESLLSWDWMRFPKRNRSEFETAGQAS